MLSIAIRHLTATAAVARSSSPTAAVRTALAAHGPLSTHALHSTLHELYTPLPARLPPANYLKGASRPGIGLTATSKKRSLATGFPGEEDSIHGSWSMSFLKNRVLKAMEEREEIVKLTRAKWARLDPNFAIATSSHPSPSSSSPSPPIPLEPQSKSPPKSAKNATKKEVDHIWVLKEAYASAVLASRASAEAALGKSGSVGSARVSEKTRRSEASQRDERAGYGI